MSNFIQLPSVDSNAIPLSQKGTPNGVATLDGSGLIPIGQIPPAALAVLYTVADQAARFALTHPPVNNGDSVLQVDTNILYLVKDITNLGNASGYQAYTAGSAVNFTGSLVGDVTGTQGATVVSTVGTSSAANVHAAELLANAATDANNASTIVRRSAGGNFTATTITAALNGAVTGNVTGDLTGNVLGNVTGNVTGNVSGSSATFTGSLSGDVTSTGMTTAVAFVGTSSAANVHAAELLANAATNANTASAIVKRDASGNFSAGVVTARIVTTGFTGAYVAKTADYTLTAADLVVGADCTAGTIAITLPSAVGITGRQYIIKRLSDGGNTVNVITTSSQTIDGGTTANLAFQYQSITVVSDGSNWFII